MIKSFEEVTNFHGHEFPGSAIGYKVAKIAIERSKINSSEDEEILAIVENDSPALDSIQVVLSCTFGKGNLIFKDYGKSVYTIVNRENGKAIRLSGKNSFKPMEIDLEFTALKTKERNQPLTEDEKKILIKKTKEVCKYIINMSDEDIFNIEEIEISIPKKASIYKPIQCDKCGELTANHRVNKKDGKNLCIPCIDKLKYV